MYTPLVARSDEQHHPRCKPISPSFPLCKLDFLWLSIVLVVIVFLLFFFERTCKYFKRLFTRVTERESRLARVFCCCVRRRKEANVEVKPNAQEADLEKDPYISKPWSSFNNSLLMEEGKVERPLPTYSSRSPDTVNTSAPAHTPLLPHVPLTRNPSSNSRSSSSPSRRNSGLRPLILYQNLSETGSTISRPSSPIVPADLRTSTPPPAKGGRARAGTVVGPRPLVPLATRPAGMGILSPPMVRN